MYLGSVKYDTEGVKRHEAFVANPQACLLLALMLIAAETEATKALREYARFVALVYGNVKPTFEESVRGLQNLLSHGSRHYSLS